MDDLTTPAADAVEEEPVTIQPEYPATVIGLLMDLRDQAAASAQSSRVVAQDALDFAAQSDDRAARFQGAIDALGGEPAA